MFLVLACPRCRRSKLVERGRKQATCGLCSRTLYVQDLRPFAVCATLEEAQHAAGAVNAKLAGRAGEFATAFVAAPAPEARHDSPYDAAAAAARRFASEKDRVDAIARALTKQLRDWTEDDLAAAFDVAGLPRRCVEPHLRRMRATETVFEPRPARYRAV